jgi:hypothetical protein
VIGADDITLDLNGHTVDGDGAATGVADIGIDNTAGHNGVTIKGGSVREFVEGVVIDGARDNHVTRLSTSRHLHAGIVVFEASHVLVERTSSFANIAGTLLVGNLATRSGDDGLDVQSSHRDRPRRRRRPHG